MGTCDQWSDLKLPHLLGALEEAGVIQLASDLLGGTAHPVSAVVFDKPEGAKWSVPAYQDTIHPLSGEGPAPGFESWSRKDGLAYAKFPETLLSKMVALRIHCDDCAEDGALQVVPETHHSHLPSGEVMDLPQSRFVSCPGRAGSVLAMSPLLVHRSGPSGEGRRRRVLHVVFSAQKRPVGLSWSWPPE